MTETPDRITVSFPDSSPLDTERIDELVEQSDCANRSEWIRTVLADVSDADDIS